MEQPHSDKFVPSIEIENITENFDHMLLVEPPVSDLPIVPVTPTVPIVPATPTVPIVSTVPIIPVTPRTPGPWITKEHFLQLSNMLQGYTQMLMKQIKSLFDLYRGQKNMVSNHILPKPLEYAQLDEHYAQYNQCVQTNLTACYSYYWNSKPAPSLEQIQNCHTLLIWQAKYQLEKYWNMITHFECGQQKLYQHLLHLMTNEGLSVAQACQCQKQLRLAQLGRYDEIMRHQCIMQIKQVQLIEKNISVPEIDSIPPAPTCGMKCMMCREDFSLEEIDEEDIDPLCNCCTPVQTPYGLKHFRISLVHRMCVANGRVVYVCDTCSEYTCPNGTQINHINGDCAGRPKLPEEIVRSLYNVTTSDEDASDSDEDDILDDDQVDPE